MSNGRIKYIGFYDITNNKNENRQVGFAAMTKIDYICRALNRNNYEIEIVSPSWTNNTRGFYKGKVEKIIDGITLRTFATFGAKNKIQRIIKYIFSLTQLFFYLLINSEKEETIIVYHSVILSLPIRLAKFIKKLKIILEVEEIYQDAQSLSKFMKKNEYKFFKIANKYIFATELLNNKLNIENKPHIIIYGTYQVEENKKNKFQDGKIHIVYAGTFDSRKGGALAAVAVAEYLPKDYHVHIIGFGSNEDTKLLLDKIKQVAKKSDATITYDGILKGEEYTEFLQKCEIGLSTQIPDASYNNTSFPSKILSYMANGLHVVSTRIKAIEISAIGDAVYYYNEQTPEAIAKAIMSIDINQPYNSTELIKKLDEEFVQNIKNLLGS